MNFDQLAWAPILAMGGWIIRVEQQLAAQKVINDDIKEIKADVKALMKHQGVRREEEDSK